MEAAGAQYFWGALPLTRTNAATPPPDGRWAAAITATPQERQKAVRR